MNKAFSKKAVEASRKHEKKGESRNRNCFVEGVNFCDKNSPKQFTEKDMFQLLYDGIGHFAHKNNLTINGKDLQNWFKKNIKK